MRKKLLYQEQLDMLRRMRPYAIAMFFGYISTSFFSYETLFMQLNGFSTEVIGTVGGIACILTVFAEMLSSRISDASRSVKRTAVMGMCVTALCSMLVPLALGWYVGTFSVMLVILVTRDTIVTPASTLRENWVLRSSYHEKFDYGILKSVGAVGGILGSFLASAVMVFLCRRMEQVKAANTIFFLSGVLVLASGLSMLPMKNAPAAPKEKVTKENLNPMRLLKNGEYLALMLVYGISCAALNPAESFLSVLMMENRLDTARLGFIVGLQSVFQFPVLLLFSKMQDRLPMGPLAAVGTILYGVTNIFRGNATAMWILALSAVFQGTAASLLVTSAYNYIYELVPIELRGTGQSYFVVFGSLGGAIGLSISGKAIDAWGVQNFYIRAGIFILCVGVVYFLLTRLQKRRRAEKQTECTR